MMKQAKFTYSLLGKASEKKKLKTIENHEEKHGKQLVKFSGEKDS